MTSLIWTLFVCIKPKKKKVVDFNWELIKFIKFLIKFRNSLCRKFASFNGLKKSQRQRKLCKKKHLLDT